MHFIKVPQSKVTHNRFIYLALILINLYYNVILCLFAYFSVFSLKEKLVIEFFKLLLFVNTATVIWTHMNGDLKTLKFRVDIILRTKNFLVINPSFCSSQKSKKMTVKLLFSWSSPENSCLPVSWV